MYHPDDLKGKGEPSYTIEKALKDHKQIGDSGTEMTTRHQRHSSAGYTDAPDIVLSSGSHDADAGVEGSNSTGNNRGHTRSVSDSLKKRFGSIRRRKQDVEA